MWEELAGVAGWWDVPWCIGENINCMGSQVKRGTTRASTSMGGFNEFISSFGLMDLPLEGGTFTWSNTLTPSPPLFYVQAR